MPASGVHLDRLGKIVGEPRGNRGDDAYAAGIRVRILSNRSEGRPDDLLAIAKLLLKAGTITYHDYAKAYTVTGVGSPDVAQALADALRRADPAGVGSDIVVGTAVDVWILDDVDNPGAGNATAAVGDVTPVMAGVY